MFQIQSSPVPLKAVVRLVMFMDVIFLRLVLLVIYFGNLKKAAEIGNCESAKDCPVTQKRSKPRRC